MLPEGASDPQDLRCFIQAKAVSLPCPTHASPVLTWQSQRCTFGRLLRPCSTRRLIQPSADWFHFKLPPAPPAPMSPGDSAQNWSHLCPTVSRLRLPQPHLFLLLSLSSRLGLCFPERTEGMSACAQQPCTCPPACVSIHPRAFPPAPRDHLAEPLASRAFTRTLEPVPLTCPGRRPCIGALSLNPSSPSPSELPSCQEQSLVSPIFL